MITGLSESELRDLRAVFGDVEPVEVIGGYCDPLRIVIFRRPGKEFGEAIRLCEVSRSASNLRQSARIDAESTREALLDGCTRAQTQQLSRRISIESVKANPELKNHRDMTGRIYGSWSVVRLNHVSEKGTDWWVAAHSCGHEQKIAGKRFRESKQNPCLKCGER